MAKRIYIPKDIQGVARKTGIPVETLEKARRGEVELSAEQLEKLRRLTKEDIEGDMGVARERGER